MGGAWGWSGRLIVDEGELAAILRAGTTEIYRLRRRGETAGFAELDRGRPKETEIAYFGLLPGFIGRGLGGFLLNWAIHRAWRTETERVCLHTCQYDHPRRWRYTSGPGSASMANKSRCSLTRKNSSGISVHRAVEIFFLCGSMAYHR